MNQGTPFPSECVYFSTTKGGTSKFHNVDYEKSLGFLHVH